MGLNVDVGGRERQEFSDAHACPIQEFKGKRGQRIGYPVNKSQKFPESPEIDVYNARCTDISRERSGIGGKSPKPAGPIKY